MQTGTGEVTSAECHAYCLCVFSALHDHLGGYLSARCAHACACGRLMLGEGDL